MWREGRSKLGGLEQREVAPTRQGVFTGTKPGALMVAPSPSRILPFHALRFAPDPPDAKCCDPAI